MNTDKKKEKNRFHFNSFVIFHVGMNFFGHVGSHPRVAGFRPSSVFYVFALEREAFQIPLPPPMMTKTGLIKYKYPLFILFGTVLVLPAFLSGKFLGHDVLYHLQWCEHFSDRFWAGDLYPRWLGQMNAGLGSPVFFFYGPAPFWVAAIIHPLFPSDVDCWLTLGMSFLLALVLSGITAFWWLRKIVDPRSAFLAALFYMAMPYHVLIDLFNRFGYAEFWAFAILPLILSAAKDIAAERKGGIARFSFSAALLLLVHPPTVLYFVPLSVAYSWFESAHRKIKVVGKALFGWLFAAGLSSFYLLPAFFHVEHIQAGLFHQGRYDYARSFLLSGVKHQPEIFHGFWNLLLGVTITSALLAISLFLLSRNNRKLSSPGDVFWLAVSVLTTSMMFSVSQPIWEIVPFLQWIQFPWRLNVVLCLSTAALLASALASRGIGAGIGRKALLGVVAGLCLGQVSAVVMVDWMNSVSSTDEGAEAIITSELGFRRGAEEYLPRWVGDDLVAAIRGENFQGWPDRVNILEGAGEARVVHWKPGQIGLKTSGQSGIKVRIAQFYFPNWRAVRAVDGALLPVEASKEGLIKLSVPPDAGLILLKFTTDGSQWAGRALSLLTLLALLVGSQTIWYRRRILQPPGQGL